MKRSKFDEIQVELFKGLDRLGCTYEILEMGCHPNNFYLRLDIDGKVYELSEVEEETDGYKLSQENKDQAIAIAQKVQRGSKRY